MTGVQLTLADLDRIEQICGQVKGYSGPIHYSFFKGVLEQYPQVKNLLILGVYHGRDICFIQDILKRYHPTRSVFIYGVDKFDDWSCDDWPESKKNLPWIAAGFGEPPSFDKALSNIRAIGSHGMTLLKHCTDEHFLATTTVTFDLIYLDTSHDYATVARQLKQVGAVCAGPETLIAGDDYSDVAPMEGANWGVVSAVREGFTSHEVFGGWIWISDASRLKS